ncbi:MAG: FAD binding domain-containing protein, partial [Alphaproteobacteria bacterium]|nr:FAD binding domain-containing protein [Alphaproteobacteria bacterium]
TLDLLATLEDAKILAGGQSLMPMMAYRYVMPANVIDINRVAELAAIEERDGALVIGAMARQRDLELSPVVRQRCPLLYEALLNVGHVQTRNRGTIGGSLSHLDPAAELPGVLAAHDAVLHAESRRGGRDIPMAEWSLGFMTPNLEPDEILTRITIPLWPVGHGVGFVEFARRHGDFAMAGTAALLALSASGSIERASLAVVGVDTAPVRLPDAEAQLAGATPGDATFAAAAESAASVPGLDDVHASKAYRQKLAVVMTRRALQQAFARAQAGGGRDD